MGLLPSHCCSSLFLVVDRFRVLVFSLAYDGFDLLEQLFAKRFQLLRIDPEAVVYQAVPATSKQTPPASGSDPSLRRESAYLHTTVDIRVLSTETMITSYMDLRVQGDVPPDPFLGAADLFETEFSLEHPVHVRIRDDPDERTWAGHYDDHHVLNVSKRAATSAMARELAVHELSHMARYEEGHASHVQSTEEALYLGLAGEEVERRKLAHCYQIANHMKDIYADDITLSVAPARKLLGFLESTLAAAVADRPGPPRHGARPTTSTADPEITAVNAAFALALVERHDLATRSHRIYDLARAAGSDAPSVDVAAFKRRFLALGPDPSESDYRKALVSATRAYAV